MECGKVKVKICGLRNLADAEFALAMGADAVGFVFEPDTTRYVGDDSTLVRDALALGPFGTIVAVFGHYRSEVVLPEQAVVQYITGFPPLDRRRIQVVRIRQGEEPMPDAFVDDVEAFILEPHHEEQLGGTGTRVSLDSAEAWARICPRPVILAGGLDPDNVATAIERVKPYGVDVSSGVESSRGTKDRGRIRAFIEAAKRT